VTELERTGPTVRRGKSPQDYRTPIDFLEAVQLRFGPISFDLAATRDACVAGVVEPGVREPYFGPDHSLVECRDALAVDWDELCGLLWLNPPFDNIRPWVQKCALVRDRPGFTLLLAPASVGTEWFAEFVHGKAFVMPLRPRLKFCGQTDPYPRDLMLAAYGYGVTGFAPWRWDVP
jgi:hypothetical protein